MAWHKLLILSAIGLCIFATDPMEDPNLFEGDMILTEDQKRDYLSGQANYQIPLAAKKTDLWPKVIPYDIHSSLSSEAKAVNAIKEAIADYERLTCLRFIKQTTEQGHISFYQGRGCSSRVGYSGGMNSISLSSGCWSKGTVMHEIAHSLGFYHEQSRPDRDEHVTILWDNIYSSMRHNFKKQKTSNVDSMNVPYDYASVMHYSKFAFSKRRGKITIQTKDPSKQDVIGSRTGFSHYDIVQMNLLYKCPGTVTIAPTNAPATGPTMPPTAAPNTPAGCRDLNKNCDYWRNKGYCTDSGFKNYMKKNCQLTCNFCSGAATNIPLTTKAPVTSNVNCKDSYVDCPRWKTSGYCTSPSFKDYMKKNCKLSCGYCQGSTSPPVTGSCGKPEVQQSRVISGVNAIKGAWPWQILMLYDGRTSCGGSIVAPNWIVTAAHCVSGREGQASSFKVRVGEHKTSTTTDGQHQDIQVEKIISHPSYSRKTINNDIALMKLKNPIRFGTYVKPVCLPDQGQHVPVGTQCYITGWGKIRHPGSMHHTLQQGKMPVVSQQTCASINTANFGVKITDQMVCAGHGGKTRVSGCHGDSGGPFVCQTGANGAWVLHGAVSWGSGKCEARDGYTVFARVASFKNWLDQTMASN